MLEKFYYFHYLFDEKIFNVKSDVSDNEEMDTEMDMYLRFELEKILNGEKINYHEKLHFQKLNVTWKKNYMRVIDCDYMGLTELDTTHDSGSPWGREIVVVKDKNGIKFTTKTHDIKMYSLFPLFGTFSEVECIKMEKLLHQHFRRLRKPNRLWIQEG